MRPINAPLNLGQTGEEVANLQEVLMLLVSSRIISLTDDTLVNQMADEHVKQLFGNATATICRAYCAQHDITVADGDDIINTAVAAALNAQLATLQSTVSASVSGQLQHVSGKALSEVYTVAISLIAFRGMQLLGTVSTDATGFYKLVYTTDVATAAGRKGFRIVVTSPAGTIVATQDFYKDGSSVSADITLDDADTPLVSEYDEVYAALTAILGETAIADIHQDDPAEIKYLTDKTGESELVVRAMAQAAALHNLVTGVSVQTFYGLLRQNMPADIYGLFSQPVAVLQNALSVAVANNVIPAMSNEALVALAASLPALLLSVYSGEVATGSAADSALYRMVNNVLGSAAMTEKLLGYYYNFDAASGESFLDYLVATDTSFAPYRKQLAANFDLAALTAGNPALVIRLLSILTGNIEQDGIVPDNANPQASAFAALSQDTWGNIIAAAKTADNANFFYPDFITGDSDAAKNAGYAAYIKKQAETIYPTHTIAAAAAADTATPFPNLGSHLAAFISLNDSFDIRTANIIDMSAGDTFNFSGISDDKGAFINETGIAQRLMNLTTSYPLMAQLAADNLHSSLQIARQPQETFVTTYAANAGGADAARAVYDVATLITLKNLSTTLTAYSGAKPFGIPSIDVFTQDQSYADWRSLFGSLDSCNCSQCQSVFSPAAYFTDLLRVLETGMPGLYAQLVARRPDIVNIKLTCKNTNTPVPQIDIANELLEDLASQSASANNAYMMYARQTVADAATQRAMPVYVNANVSMSLSHWVNGNPGSDVSVSVSSPYGALSDALYPWTLPYNFYKRQIDTHLDLAGVAGSELIQRFGSFDKLDIWNDDENYYPAVIGISNQERGIIDNSNGAHPYQYYGFKASGNALSRIPDPALRGQFLPATSQLSSTNDDWAGLVSGRVDVFLQQTGLGYTDLLELLNCYTINQGATLMGIDKISADVADDACDLSKLKITNATAAILDKLHRFVRLKRALGWSYYELDKALIALSGSTTMNGMAAIAIDATMFRKLVQLREIATRLRLTIAEVVFLWKDIDVLAYQDYERSEPQPLPTEYESLFRNTLLADLNAAGYPFPANPVSITAPAEGTLVNYLSGIFNIEGAELTILLDDLLTDLNVMYTTGMMLSLSLLSHIYRRVLLMKGLQITATDWVTCKSYITDSTAFGSIAGGNSYQTSVTLFGQPFDMLRFIAFVRQVKGAGITAAQTDYLLSDKMPDAVAEDNLDASITRTLTNLRSELAKKWNPSYNAANDTDGSQLRVLLQTVMEADKAATFTRIIQTPNDTEDSDIKFLNNDIAFLIPNAGFGLNAPGPNQLSNTAQVRRSYVFAALQSYVEENILKPLIDNFFSKEFKVSEDIVHMLISGCLPGDYAALLDPHFISGITDIDRWSISIPAPTSADVPGYTFGGQFRTAFLMHKTAWLVNTFGLGLIDIQHLWQTDPPAFTDIPLLTQLPVRAYNTSVITGGPATQPVPFRQWINFLRWMQVRAFLADKAGVLYSALQAGAGKPEFVTAIGNAFVIGEADRQVLLGDVMTTTASGAFHVTYNADYTTPSLYLRLMDALEMQHLLPAPMAALVTCAYAAVHAADQDDANEIIQIVKAQYDDAQWLAAIRPVQDKLRTERRNALVAFLLANPPLGYEYTWLTDDDIYETLMLDVEMMPCMATTRILLAVNTVQLWVDRVLLGLEKDSIGNTLIMSKTNARQWQNWRKLYRIWEANRRIFVYPENWIEPELRDDKSPFFLELEKFLKQNDITADNVEDAYRTYLERLDEVAQLEIVGMYRETAQDYNTFTAANDDIIHVFGRTPEHPHTFYYRKRASNVWTAWEKMDVQIDGDHFVPVMWRNRLRFYWLVFAKDQAGGDAGAKTRSQAKYVTPAPARWKINLAWTEYKNGKWSPKQMSKDPVYSWNIIEEDPVSADHITYYVTANYNENRFWYLNGHMEKQRRFRTNFYAWVNDDGDLEFIINEVHALITSGDLYGYLCVPPANNHSFAPAQLQKNQYYYHLMTTWPNTMKDVVDAMIDRNDLVQNYGRRLGTFTVKGNNITAVWQTLDNNDYPGERNLYNDYFWSPPYAQLPRATYQLDYSRYYYALSAGTGYSHAPDGLPQSQAGPKLLGYAPDTGSGKKEDKFIVIPRELPDSYPWNFNNPATPAQLLMPYFIYTDYDNTFFVERTGDKNASVNDQSYRFHNFRHQHVQDFIEVISAADGNGLDDLLDRDFITGLPDTIGFTGTYKPTSQVISPRPDSKVDFSPGGAYSLYNWELFFHIPMLIANKLSDDQKFGEARSWYHYVFNPTVGNAPTPAYFWNFPEFYADANNMPSIQDVMSDPNLQTAVDQWANNPFEPHLIARTRPSAYMKNTVMKYLDNLIAWGDMLFRTDTRENINEATLLYVLAAQIMGRKPVQIPARAQPVVQTYASMDATGSFNAFSNALVLIENMGFIYSGKGAVKSGGQGGRQDVDWIRLPSMYYFCIPPNDKLSGYWDTIADRLFKIRNCRSIDGVERELPLFDPPIDPALLVRAAAAGLSLADVINGLNAPLPLYRFHVMSQKATELAGEVKALGSQLLSALEKKDAEHLALLRSSQEMRLLDAITEVKEQQVDEAAKQVDALNIQQTIATQRRDYYKALVDGGLNTGEQLQLDSMMTGVGLTIAEGTMAVLAAVTHLIPDMTIGAFSFGAQFGGKNIGGSTKQSADVLGIASALNNQVGSMAGIKGSYARRKAEWDFQSKTADREITQLDTQILASEIRKAIADLELENHKIQVQNAQEIDDAMRNKYTNEDLYDWMTGQISFTYFQAYKLALDIASRAERCYHYEIPTDDATTFILPPYWDSLKKGLLAGEGLAYDIRRMEAAYLQNNKRYLELSKHISLATLAPDALVQLKANKSCTVDIPEWLYDLDYPGQHMRRIKSVSVSIPCVAGPYTTVSCKLSLVKSKYRKNSLLNSTNSTDPYVEDVSANGDARFHYQYGSIQSIATSHAQNDSGMFEFSFRDERYLPFEGAGAVSTWKIELPAAYAQFDYNSISDVILHVNYSALDEGSMKDAAVTTVTSLLSNAGFGAAFSVAQQYSNSWFAYSSSFSNSSNAAPLKISLGANQFPYFCKGQKIVIDSLGVYLRSKSSLPAGHTLHVSYKEEGNSSVVSLSAPLSQHMVFSGTDIVIEDNVKLLHLALTHSGTPVNMAGLLDDIILVAACSCNPATASGTVPDDTDWDESALVALGTPASCTATASNASVALSWPAVSNATGYTIKRSLTNNAASASLLNTTTTTSYADASAANGTTYYYFISATAPGYLAGAPATASATPSANVLPANTLAWWKADAGITVQNGGVQTWADQTTNGNDVSVPSGTGAPTFIPSWSNGQPALSFGTSKALRKPLLALPAGCADITVFMVAEKTSLTTACCFELSDNFNTQSGLMFFFNDNSQDAAGISESGYALRAMPDTVDLNVKGIYKLSYYMSNNIPETVIVFNGTAYQLASNYNLVETDHPNTDAFASDSFNIGARAGSSFFADFNLAELIVIPSQTTSQQDADITAYLHSKYSI